MSFSKGEIVTATLFGVTAIIAGVLAVGGLGFWAGYQTANLVQSTPTPSPTTSLSRVPQCQNPWADSVASFNPTSNGNNNLLEAALGKPETGRNPSVNTFLSPGVGGSVVLHLAQEVINGPGNDLRIFEVTYLPHFSESAQVFASQDGVQFTFIGNATNSQGCDCDTNLTELDLGPLPSARFIRVVDTTQSTSEAFDLNAVEAIHCGNVTTSSPTPAVSGTPSPNGSSTILPSGSPTPTFDPGGVHEID